MTRQNKQIEALIEKTASEITAVFAASVTEAVRQLQRDSIASKIMPDAKARQWTPWSKRPSMQDAVEMVRNGSSIGAAARKYELPKKAVSYACHKAGVSSSHASAEKKATATG